MHLHRWLVMALSFCACSSADISGDSCVPPCAAGQGCRDGVCVAQMKCTGDGECQNDSYCEGDRCIAYGTGPRGDRNPGCTRVVPAGLLAPQIFCEWSGPEAGDPYPEHKQVLSTPLVADFDFDGHLSGEFPTSRPSIVINTYNAEDGYCGLGYFNDGQYRTKTDKIPTHGILRVLDGRTCKQKYLIDVPVNGAATPAIADINGDGRPDIAAFTIGGLAAFAYDKGKDRFVPLWTAHEAGGAASTPLFKQCVWTGPTIADLDDDGKPEVLMEGFVYDSSGLLIDKSVGRLSYSNNPEDPENKSQLAVVADLERNGGANLVTPMARWRWNKAQRKWDLVKQYRDHPVLKEWAAVADLGTVQDRTLDRSRKDGVPEIVVVSDGKAYALSLEGEQVFGPVSLPGSIGGGPPTIGDFDNDGRAEFAAAGSDSYTVFDPDCQAGADAMFCPTRRGDGILWTSKSQDLSSNITGSSLFDFEADGTAEAIYADECYARIYDGRSGEVLFSQPHSSCTWLEYPVIADVAGNFRSKLLVPSNTSCGQFITCPKVDPVFKGLRCNAAADCPNGLPCDAGYCRCSDDDKCNTQAVGGGFVCRPAPAGLMGTGNTCQAAHTGRRTGVRVFGDVLDRWVNSRPLWNQYSYSVTNIDDRGAVPRTSQQKRNWEQPGLNNFRMNVQGMLSPQAAPDLTSKPAATATCAGGQVSFTMTVCNRGTAPVGDGIPVSVYEGAMALCTGTTRAILEPGQCGQVSCSTSGAAVSGSHKVEIRANDDGKGMDQVKECIEGNGKASFSYQC